MEAGRGKTAEERNTETECAEKIAGRKRGN